MGAVFIDVVDHGVEVLERSNTASGGDQCHALGSLAILILVGNPEFPAAFTNCFYFMGADLYIGMGLGEEDEFFLGKQERFGHLINGRNG